MATKYIFNEWKEYIQAIHDNGRRNLNFKKRLEEWEKQRQEIIDNADPRTEEIDAIDAKIAAARGMATKLNNAYEAEKAKLTRRQIKKGYESPVMIECKEKITTCTRIITAYKTKRAKLVAEEVMVLLAEHDRIKPKSVELHKEKEILERFKKAFHESHIDAESLCLILEEKTGKKYSVEYAAVTASEDYRVAIQVVEKGNPARIIYNQIVDNDLFVPTQDLSSVKSFLLDMYRIEDIILNNFETLEEDSQEIFTYVLQAIEKKYFEILKEETRTVKK